MAQAHSSKSTHADWIIVPAVASLRYHEPFRNAANGHCLLEAYVVFDVRLPNALGIWNLLGFYAQGAVLDAQLVADTNLFLYVSCKTRKLCTTGLVGVGVAVKLLDRAAWQLFPTALNI